ncbi:MAG: Maf family protein [Woeseiaceae bacterium]
MNETEPVLHLASSSPRRAEILDALGIAYSAAGMDVDERRLPNEAADAMVMRLAAAKAAAARNERAGVILAADTAVVAAGDVFGKPQDQDDALAMLASLSGKLHKVMTGVAVYWDGGERLAMSTSEVRFREIKPEEALAYWQSGEPRGKAGAYAIQGLGGVFVEEIRGSYSGVVGLPVFETAQLLAAADIDVLKRNLQE